MLVIQAIRLAFLLTILIITVVFQALQPEFVNVEVLIPVYLMMAVEFVLNAVYLTFFDRFLKLWYTTAILFFLESAFVTGLIYFTGVNQSIFLFLYLVNIILCGFVFQRRGAWILSFWTSILFSFLMIIGPEIKGQTLYFTVGLNNLAFFAVAGLSGYLSEQLNFMGVELLTQGKHFRALKNLNQLIIENIATGLVTIDQEGRILLANKAAHGILDLAQNAMLGRQLDEVFSGLMKRICAIEFLRNEQVSNRFDWPYRVAFGDNLTLAMTISELRGEAGESTGYVLAFEDLTKVRRLEFAVRQSEKLAAVGQLAAGIAHEIRNPLASISGCIQLLGTMFTSRQEEEQKLMSIVLKEIDRLNNLITEFLDFVRPDQIREDRIDCNDLLKEVLDMVRMNKGLRADVQQITTFSATRAISGHRDKLKQALLNIVINAYQAMHEIPRPVVEIGTKDSGDSVVIWIKDHGVGIDEGRLRKIFEPFHTTKPKGTGLGLAVTHKIIESHNGQVFVESVKGSGAEFTLEFPARQGKIDLADSSRTSDDRAWKKRGNG